MDVFQNTSSSLWDPSHDWILQFDNVIKVRSNKNTYTSSFNKINQLEIKPRANTGNENVDCNL